MTEQTFADTSAHQSTDASDVPANGAQTSGAQASESRFNGARNGPPSSNGGPSANARTNGNGVRTVSPATNAKVPESESESDAGRILHFDATLRRKEKMRERAAAGTPHGTTVVSPAANTDAPAQAPPVSHFPPARATTSGRRPASMIPPAAPIAQSPAERPRPTFAQPPFPNPHSGSQSAHSPAPSPTAPTPDPSASASIGVGMSGAELDVFLIDFVVEQTGYPAEMVDLDADLEADLGIDSIKKAQLFGELAERFDIHPTGDEELSLDDFPTLRHVLNFLENVPADASPTPARSESEASAPSTPTPARSASEGSTPAAPTPARSASEGSTSTALSTNAAAGSAAGPDGKPLDEFLIDFVVEQTGYPAEMVELDADLEADLGIDSIKKAQLFGELAEHFDIRSVSADELSLDDFPTLGDVLEFLKDVPTAAQSSTTAPATPPPVASIPFAQASPAPLPAPTSTNDSANGSYTNGNGRHAPVRTNPITPVANAPLVDSYRAAQSEPRAVHVATSFETGDAGDLEAFLIDFVVEQTGYPAEMVELDADLEADLGIDSIKKAQLFGELAEHFDVRVSGNEDLSLDDYPTLRHVMAFLEGVPRKALV